MEFACQLAVEGSLTGSQTVSVMAQAALIRKELNVFNDIPAKCLILKW
jgi:hypothetical protein